MFVILKERKGGLRRDEDRGGGADWEVVGAIVDEQGGDVAVLGALPVDGGLVGLDDAEDVAGRDLVAYLLLPRDEVPLLHGGGQGGHGEEHVLGGRGGEEAGGEAPGGGGGEEGAVEGGREGQGERRGEASGLGSAGEDMGGTQAARCSA